MPETRIEVRTFQVDNTCAQCSEGKMRPTGVMFFSNPPLYEHRCTDCDYVMGYRKSYPYIDYEEIK